MDVSLIADPITLAVQQQQWLLHNRPVFISNANPQISAVIFDAIAPPPVKSNSTKTIRRRHLRKRRRTRRRSYSGGESEDGGEDFWFFSDDGDGDGNGLFGGGGGGGGNWSGGGSGWNFDKFGGQNWDESSSSWWSTSKFAYGFVYEVIYWIALSNCLHFALGKVSRIMADSEREKMTLRLISVC